MAEFEKREGQKSLRTCEISFRLKIFKEKFFFENTTYSKVNQFDFHFFLIMRNKLERRFIFFIKKEIYSILREKQINI